MPHHFVANYEQLKNARTLYGAKLKVVWCEAPDFFAAVGLAEGMPFPIYYQANAKPDTFHTDFGTGTAYQVDGINL